MAQKKIMQITAVNDYALKMSDRCWPEGRDKWRRIEEEEDLAKKVDMTAIWWETMRKKCSW